MKVVIISDTHGQHEDLGQLNGDVLIHCGDMCADFSDDPGELERIDEWFGRHDFDLILCIGGNHDFNLDARNGAGRPFQFANAICLEDGFLEYRGKRFFGAPWVLDLPGWAFNLELEERREKWGLIPEGLDFLITHVPPKHILDTSRRRDFHFGCPVLASVVRDVSPRVHCFGHNHASYGRRRIADTIYINASNVTSDGRGFRIQNPPVEMEV